MRWECAQGRGLAGRPRTRDGAAMQAVCANEIGEWGQGAPKPPITYSRSPTARARRASNCLAGYQLAICGGRRGCTGDGGADPFGPRPAAPEDSRFFLLFSFFLFVFFFFFFISKQAGRLIQENCQILSDRKIVQVGGCFQECVPFPVVIFRCDINRFVD